MGILDPREQEEGPAAEKARARWGMAPAASDSSGGQQPRQPVPSLTAPRDQLHVFAYVTAEKAWLYRAVMGAFMAAKQRFLLHLRPVDVRESLSHQGLSVSLEAVDVALKQLAAWESLRADPDTADVHSVEEFYRELSTQPGLEAIHTTRWVWNGRERVLDDGSGQAGAGTW